MWKKSTHSGYNGNCVEVDLDDDEVISVRDSKEVDGPVLTFSSAEWRAFLAERKAAREAEG
jgi:hypothetical protein